MTIKLTHENLANIWHALGCARKPEPFKNLDYFLTHMKAPNTARAILPWRGLLSQLPVPDGIHKFNQLLDNKIGINEDFFILLNTISPSFTFKEVKRVFEYLERQYPQQFLPELTQLLDRTSQKAGKNHSPLLSHKILYAWQICVASGPYKELKDKNVFEFMQPRDGHEYEQKTVENLLSCSLWFKNTQEYVHGMLRHYYNKPAIKREIELFCAKHDLFVGNKEHLFLSAKEEIVFKYSVTVDWPMVNNILNIPPAKTRQMQHFIHKFLTTQKLKGQEGVSCSGYRDFDFLFRDEQQLRQGKREIEKFFNAFGSKDFLTANWLEVIYQDPTSLETLQTFKQYLSAYIIKQELDQDLYIKDKPVCGTTMKI